MEDGVLETYAKLKQLNSSYELKSIKGHYYIYISFSKWDAGTRTCRKVSIYKGKIAPDGTFTPVRRHHKLGRTAPADARPGAGDAQEAAPAAPTEQRAEESRMRENSRRYEKILLTALSMNGRISLPVLGSMLGLSVSATSWQLSSLEKRYGISYLPEIDPGKFGYMQFLVTVKFTGDTPPVDKLTSILAKEPRIQLAALTAGDSDLFVYLLAKTNAEAISAVISVRTALDEFESAWSTISLNDVYGFIPIRNEFVGLLKEKGELLDREFAVLKELNTEGAIEFAEIDKRHSFDKGRAQYSYHKLRSEGKIRRMTITLRALPVRYVGLILANIINRRLFGVNKPKLLAEIINEPDNRQANKFTAIYDMASPDGFLFCFPVIEQDALDEYAGRLMDLGLGIKLSKLVITNVIVGRFCYRHFDNAYSAQQEMLEDNYKAPKAEKKDYERTGKERQKDEYRGDIRGSKFAEKSD